MITIGVFTITGNSMYLIFPQHVQNRDFVNKRWSESRENVIFLQNNVLF